MLNSTKYWTLIHNLHVLKSYSTKINYEFPQKGWRFCTVWIIFLKNCEKPAQQIDSRAVADLAHHILLTLTQSMMLSKKSAPRTHKATRQIARETGILQRSVGRIIHKDIQRKCLKKRL